MALKDFKYKTDFGTVCYARLKDNADAATMYGTETTDPVSTAFHVSDSLNAHQFGIHPRTVIWRATVTSGSASATKEKEIVYIDKDGFDTLKTGTAADKNFTIGGLTYKPHKKKEETYV